MEDTLTLRLILRMVLGNRGSKEWKKLNPIQKSKILTITKELKISCFTHPGLPVKD